MPPKAKTSTNTSTSDTSTEVSVVEQLADDAAQAPTEYPPGVPELKDPLAIRPRSRRAEFKRRYAEVVDRYEAVNAVKDTLDSDQDPPVGTQLRVLADMDEVCEAVDAMLRIAAVDEHAYAAWSDTVSDEQLLQTFAVYQVRTQPGEAHGSAS